MHLSAKTRDSRGRQRRHRSTSKTNKRSVKGRNRLEDSFKLSSNAKLQRDEHREPRCWSRLWRRTRWTERVASQEVIKHTILRIAMTVKA